MLSNNQKYWIKYKTTFWSRSSESQKQAHWDPYKQVLEDPYKKNINIWKVYRDISPSHLLMDEIQKIKSN